MHRSGIDLQSDEIIIDLYNTFAKDGNEAGRLSTVWK